MATQNFLRENVRKKKNGRVRGVARRCRKKKGETYYIRRRNCHVTEGRYAVY